MPHRFFVESPIASNRATLAGSEAHHVQHVMRMHVGDELLLFDGGGSEFRGRIESMGRQQIEVTVLQRHEHNVELAAELTVGAAHDLVDRAEEHLRAAFPDVIDIVVHVEPAPPEADPSS